MNKIISLRVSNEFDRSIRILAAQMDMNRSEFLRAALREKMDREINERQILLSQQTAGETIKVDYGN